ncbi:ROK family protein [Oceanobacillus sojae]|uniref:Transcriptional regulator n=1 Tax=Oceanobacillus sojae TaxID=582851 RepID=A0A511ZM01_9BACI|nr:ROK family protein [Oceanobacillus sojae]GEN88475.1 transcriptional regulator [Oceanobacillus sojae]
MTNILSFDFGGTHIKYGVVDTDGKIRTKEKKRTPKTLESLILLIKNQLKQYSHEGIKGIAISSPGSVSDEGIIYGFSAIPYIHGPNIKKHIEAETGLTVHIENDANCAALAEVWKGAATGKEEVAVVVIGTGIGGALIKNGVIHKGDHLHGGEFGYMILDSNNLGSGMNTFSETASTFSIRKRVAQQKQIDISSITGEQIFLKAEQGDEVCKQAISEFFHMLAIGLYNIQYIYDPELILIGGGISTREDLIQQLNKELEWIERKIDAATLIPEIDRCYFNADANLIGAVYHYLQKTS